jgi:hypothetical protein
MELEEAVKQRVPVQIRIPNPRNPREATVRAVAEVFLVETRQGPAVIWLDPFWCGGPPAESCHIAYASPRSATSEEGRRAEVWIDSDPRYGPKCLVYQKPFLMERLVRDSRTWLEHNAWQVWRKERPKQCGRQAAWGLVKDVFGDLIVARQV